MPRPAVALGHSAFALPSRLAISPFSLLLRCFPKQLPRRGVDPVRSRGGATPAACALRHSASAAAATKLHGWAPSRELCGRRRRTAPGTEEEEQKCRICRHPAEPERPLRHPCACRGNIRFVHDDYQLRWLSTTRQRRCEVCGQEISIRPIHGVGASALAKLASLIVSLLCLILTVKVALELTSLYLWRLALARSRAEAFRLLSARPFEPPVLAQLALRAERVFHAKYGGRRSRCQVAVLRLLQFSVAVTMVDMVLACTSAFIPFTLGRIILLRTGEFDSFAATSSVLLVGYGFIFSLALGATFAWLLHTTGGVFPRLARGFRALCRLPELAWDFCVYDLDKYVVDEPIVIGQRLEDVADGR
ncbi:uncharacterized protein [Aegilops tauschii subsp. strangulata]|nr:uncharacterized protein LOC109746613 [Aegilops tauschii subsp. strangulata]